MKKLAVLIVCLIATAVGYGQQASVKGCVSDSFEHKTLAKSVVALLQAKDSILYRFTRTDAAGKFAFDKVPPGDYLLMITVPGYADYAEKLVLADTSRVNYGNLFMTLKARLLEDVVVRQTVAAIKMKGDTTEYKADSFHVMKDANVEDLLKKLPGIQVNSKGEITAHGQTVKKVLVDGEEFFGDDPTLVTQNLRADMVDKVQVFDKTSEQAAFTGVDDGVKDKTINLKLKADKKKGYFSKLTAGQGTDSFQDYQAMLNFFKNKEKISGYGIKSTTGKTGLNWDEKSNFGQSDAENFSYDESTGDYMYEGGGGNLGGWDGRFDGQGLPAAVAAGLHYNNKWDDDKKSVNANYQMLDLDVKGSRSTQAQYLLPDSLYYQNSGTTFNNSVTHHRADGKYELKIDSSSTFKIFGTIGNDHKITADASYTNSLDRDSVLVNQGTTTSSYTGDNRLLNGTAIWMKKLPKKGRTLTVNLSGRYTDGDTKGFLNARTVFYKEGVYSYEQRTDQFKTQNNRNVQLNARVTYTEPLSTHSTLLFNYGAVLNNSSSERLSYNATTDGKYTQLDTAFSSNYVYDIFTHQGGATYSYSDKKIKARVGSNIGITSFNQEDRMFHMNRTRHFINWFPQASFNYSFSQQRRLGIEYSGNTRQPSIEALQPLRQNENPLYITIGNPDLKPTFSNRFTIRYNDYKVLAERGIWAYASYNISNNAISSLSIIDSAGKTTSQQVNVNGNQSFYTNINYDKKLKKLNLNLRPELGFNYSRNVNYVNGLLNVNKTANYTFGLGVSRYKEKKYEIGVSMEASYATTTSSIQRAVQPNYWTFYIRPELNFDFPWNIELRNNGDFTMRQKNSVFTTNNNIFLWNASLGKKLLKNKSLLIKLSVNDILNQNLGFSRSGGSNYIMQNENTTIRRYGMLSVVWNFNKMGGQK